MRTWLVSAWMLVAACGGGPGGAARDEGKSASAASLGSVRAPAEPVRARRPRAPGDACERPPAGLSRDVHAAAPPPVAGNADHGLTAAKAFFDRNEWAAAEPALRDVVDGRTGDDEGNRQLAEFYLAVTLYRLGKLDESVSRFRAIAHRPGHMKHHETLLWIVHVAEDHPAMFRFDDLSDYDRREVDSFNNMTQREVYGALLYLMGHLRYDQGDDEDAVRYFSAATQLQPWFAEAEKCLRRVSGRSEASPSRPNRSR